MKVVLPLTEFRCECGKLLAIWKGEPLGEKSVLEIKCTRCKALNIYPKSAMSVDLPEKAD